MIGIVWLTLRVRWPRALSACLLAMFTLAVAVALPAYLARADAAMIATEIGHASTAEVTISAHRIVSSPADSPAGSTAGSPAGSTAAPTVNSIDARPESDFVQAAQTALAGDWLTTIVAADIDVDTAAAAPGGSDLATIPEVVFRQGYCAHVAIVAGRCPVATREVLLDTGLASRLHVGVGDVLPLHQTLFTTDGWLAKPAFGVVSIVGTYRVIDERDPYWGTHAYFSIASADRGDVLPILTQPGTLDLLPHTSERQYVDAVLRPAGLRTAHLPDVRDRIATLGRPAGNIDVATSIPAVLDRIDADRATLRQVAPGLAVPLVGLGCFALFLTIAHAAAGRRPEFAVVRLRGLSPVDRWWVGAAESLAPVVLAIPLGLFAGDLLARAVAAMTLTGTAGTAGTAGAGIAAGLDGVGSRVTIGLLLLATVAGCMRPLSATVTDLLRRVPDRHRAWRAVPVQASIVVLAVVTVVQSYAQPGGPAGVTLIAPAIVVAAVAVLMAQVVPAAAVRVGVRAIASGGNRSRRPRIGLGLAALAVARRPGTHRLLVVEVIAVGMLGFTIAASVTAAHARAAFVRTDLGAARVLTVGSTTPDRLLRAVRTADPSGRYAMAAMPVPVARKSDPPLLAVDASRLAAVALPPAGTSLGAEADALRASGARPVTLTGAAIRVDVTARSLSLTLPRVDLVAELLPADGRPVVAADFGTLRAGRRTYAAPMPGCDAGCRLVALTIVAGQDATVPLAVTVHRLLTSATAFGTSPPTAATVPLTDVARWRSVPAVPGPNPAQVTADASGLTVSVAAAAQAANGIIVAPVSGAVPIVSAGAGTPTGVAGLDTVPVSVRTAGRVSALPRVADRGALVDLDRLTVAAIRPDTALPAEVWLTADTPPAVVAALPANGLRILSTRTDVAERAYLAGQGPAVGLAFAVAAAVGLVLLAVVCALLVFGVERADRTADLRALRIQGLPARTAVRSLVVGQLALVMVGGVIGLVASAGAWILTSDRMPVFVAAGRPGLDAVHLPALALAGGVAAGALLLGTVAVLAALGTTRPLRPVSDGRAP